MTTALPQSTTLEAFLKLPETEPASEFIDGHVYQKPMPQGKHSRLQLKLCEAINGAAEAQQIALAFPELRCTFAGRSLVPDVAVFTWDHLPLNAAGEVENIFTRPPDWTVEILSPDQNPTRVIGNILHCLECGTQVGWFVDPEARAVLAFLPEQQPMELTGEDRLPVPAFLPLDLTAARLFSWLKPGRSGLRA